jgi:hypothetical protein
MAYPEDKERLEKRDEELKFERMDNVLVSMYVQWNDNDPDYQDYTQTKYASGRIVTRDHHRGGKPTTTWGKTWERIFKIWGNHEND